MTIALKATTMIVTCLVLAGCIETVPTEPSTNNQSTESTSQRNSVINGFFRSRVMVTDASGAIMQDTNIRLSGDGRLISEDYTSARLSPQPPRAYGRYEYDDNGNWTRHLLNMDGGVEIDKYLRYDADGRLAGATESDESGTEFIESYRYDAVGMLTDRYRSMADGATGGSYNRSFEYNSNDQLERLLQGNPSIPGPGGVVYFYYNEDGRLTESQTDLDFNGGIDILHAYSYDSNGNVSLRVAYDPAGALIEQVEYSYTATDKTVFNETLFEMLYYPM